MRVDTQILRKAENATSSGRPDSIKSWSDSSVQWVLGPFGHGHFGLGRFGLDISATDVSATENAEGGRFGHNHKFWVWRVCMHKCVMHLLKSNMHVNTYS